MKLKCDSINGGNKQHKARIRNERTERLMDGGAGGWKLN